MEELISRINYLAKKSKDIGLSQEEKIEQAKLREEYLEIFRSKMRESLKTVRVVDTTGADVTPEKLKEFQNRTSLN